MEPDALAQACVEAGLGGAAPTEHNPTNHALTIEAFEETGLIFIPAREVSCEGAHLLIFCDSLELLAELPRLVDHRHPVFARDDVACVWAHPAAPGGSSAYAPVVPPTEVLRHLVHAIEILNGRHLHFPEAIERAIELANALAKGRTGGSDGHRSAEVGRCFTLVDAQPSAASIIEAIRLGRCEPALSATWAARHDYHYRPDLQRYLR